MNNEEIREQDRKRLTIIDEVKPRLIQMCQENMSQGKQGYAKVMVNSKYVPHLFYFIEDETKDNHHCHYEIKFAGINTRTFHFKNTLEEDQKNKTEIESNG